jgi:hypothetical protein
VSAYRDDGPGVAARLADMRAAWAMQDAPARDAILAFAARGGRIGAGLAATAVQGVLLVLLALVTLVPGVPLVRPSLFSSSLALFAAYIALKLLGRWLGERRARRHALRLVGGEGAPGEPLRAIAYLEQQRRETVLAAPARRLEPASVFLHMLSGHLFAFQLSVCAILGLGEHDSRGGSMLLALLALLVLHLVAAAAVLFGLARRAPWPLLAILLPLGAAATVYALANPPVLGIALVFQAILLVVRGWRVHGLVVSERRWLC